MGTINVATFILDDDIELLDLIKQTIEAADITNYRLFTNEKEFLEGLNEDIHVCVVDHLLHKQTGLDILKVIKQKNEWSYVIVFTAFKNPEVLISYINHDVNRFVDKDKKNNLEQLVEFLKEGLAKATRNISFVNYLESTAKKCLTENG